MNVLDAKAEVTRLKEVLRELRPLDNQQVIMLALAEILRVTPVTRHTSLGMGLKSELRRRGARK